MKKLSKNELIKESHKSLTRHYYDFSVLYYYYFKKLHNSANFSDKDFQKLKRNPQKHFSELVTKIIAEDFSLDHKGEYKEFQEDADTVFEAIFENAFERQMATIDCDNYKGLIKSIGKEQSAPIVALMQLDSESRESLDLGSSFSFLESAVEHRILSIIYRAYDEFITLLLTRFNGIGNVYRLIDKYREVVIRDGSALLGYWASKIQPIKFTRKRLKKSKDALKKKKDTKKQPVLEAYYKIDKTGMKPYRIVKTIEAFLSKQQQKVPSVDSIDRYLKEEKLI